MSKLLIFGLGVLVGLVLLLFIFAIIDMFIDKK